jgi:hypothetical protein
MADRKGYLGKDEERNKKKGVILRDSGGVV